jgi:hypothetical protein
VPSARRDQDSGSLAGPNGSRPLVVPARCLVGGVRIWRTWFHQPGESRAVIPAESYDRCLVIRLDLDSGRLLAEAPIDAAPAGISPIHHPDGWVGLPEREGQDATQAWWIRSVGQPPGQVRIEVLKVGWDDRVLSDVDPSGSKVITTPHGAAPLLVRSFPRSNQ